MGVDGSALCVLRSQHPFLRTLFHKRRVPPCWVAEDLECGNVRYVQWMRIFSTSPSLAMLLISAA